MTSQASPSGRSTAERRAVGGPSSLSERGLSGPDRCALLSAGQLEVLRLANRHLNSKEIGAQLGISSHTVDQRSRGAIQRLQVSRRSEAARLVDAFDQSRLASGDPAAEAPEPYQRLIYQAPDIDAKPVQAQTDVAVGFQIRHADRTGRVGAERFETEQRSLSSLPFLFPVSTPQQPSNKWSVGKRLAAIGIIAVSASFSVGMFLAGLESLARLVQP